MKLHEWIYEIVCEICYDKEYLYAVYVRHFAGLMNEIFEQGKIVNRGIYEIPGMKSGLKAKLEWQVEGRTNMMGLNVVSICCTIEDMESSKKTAEYKQAFELSCGDAAISRIK